MGLGRWDWDGLVVCTLAFAVYINTLGHGFVYDDHRAILTNPDVQPSTPIVQVFHNDFWGTPLSSSSSHGSYRPLVVLSFRLNVWTSGLRPLTFHLTNVILHVVATGLVLKTARVLLPPGGRSATVAATIFAVHPVHVEAVAGIVGRADVLAAIFYLMSFLFYVNYVKLRDHSICHWKKTVHRTKYVSKTLTSKSQAVTYFPETNDCLALKSCRQISFYPTKETLPYVLFLVFAILAVLSKETAISVIPLAVCYDIILHLRSTKFSNIRKSSIPSSACASAFALISIAIIRISIMGLHNPSFSKADNPIAKESSIVTRTLSFLYLPVFNSILLLFPKSLSFDWSMDAIPRIHTIFDCRFSTTVLFYSLIFKALRGLVKSSVFHKLNISSKPKSCKLCNISSPDYHLLPCRLLNNNNLPQKCVCYNSNPQQLNIGSAGIVCLFFIVLPFLPASNLFFYVGFVVAERVLYIPSIGFCLIVALGSHVLWTQGRKSMIVLCFVILLTSTYSVRTLQRNLDWKDEESLYKSAIHINPPKAYGNLGSVLSTLGRLEEAEDALRQALQHRPNMADVHYNLGNLLNRQGKHEYAIRHYEDAIKYRPTLAVAYLNLGQTMETVGRMEEAERVLVRCVVLGVEGLKDPGAHEEATRSCLRGLRRLCGETVCRPTTTRTLSDKERTLMNTEFHGFEGGGNVDDKEGLSSRGVIHNSHFDQLKTILKNKTILSGVEEHFLQALHDTPDNPASYINYGQLLVRQGRKGEAASLYLRAAQLQPQQHSLVLTAAVALRHAGRLQDAEQMYDKECQLLVRQGRKGEAASLYLRAAQLQPQQHSLVLTAAVALRHAGRLQEAEQMYARARHLRPQDATSHSNLGAILHLQGKHDQAAVSYKEALRLSPGDQVTLANLQKLNNLISRTKR